MLHFSYWEILHAISLLLGIHLFSAKGLPQVPLRLYVFNSTSQVLSFKFSIASGLSMLGGVDPDDFLEHSHDAWLIRARYVLCLREPRPYIRIGISHGYRETRLFFSQL